MKTNKGTYQVTDEFAIVLWREVVYNVKYQTNGFRWGDRAFPVRIHLQETRNLFLDLGYNLRRG